MNFAKIHLSDREDEQHDDAGAKRAYENLFAVDFHFTTLTGRQAIW
jgi:hypothetical protein